MFSHLSSLLPSEEEPICQDPRQRRGRVNREPSEGPEPPSTVITSAPAAGNRCSSAAPAAAAAIWGKLVKTTVALQADAATLRRGASDRAGNMGRTAAAGPRRRLSSGASPGDRWPPWSAFPASCR